MTIVIDATVGGEDSNSYVTEVESEAYHDTRPYNTEWEDASNETKRQALVMATRLLDWTIKWRGTKKTAEQALDWPRYSVVDERGDWIGYDSIPNKLKEATSELAFLLIKEDRIDEGFDPSTSGIEQLKVGPIDIKFTGKDSPEMIPRYITQMLMDELGEYINSGTRFANVVRA